MHRSVRVIAHDDEPCNARDADCAEIWSSVDAHVSYVRSRHDDGNSIHDLHTAHTCVHVTLFAAGAHPALVACALVDGPLKVLAVLKYMISIRTRFFQENALCSFISLCWKWKMNGRRKAHR